jgi:Sulfotransferase family
MKSRWEAVAEKPVFIGGHRKTGTTLLLALLDGHEELGVFPADSGFFYAFYPMYESEEFSQNDRIRRIKDFPFKNIRHEYESRVTGGQRAGFPFAAMESVFDSMIEASAGNTKDYLQAMVGAYVQTSPLCQGRLKAWVEKTTSTEIYANVVFDWFPKARFIHVVRDPRDNFGSLKSGWAARYQHQTDSIEWLLLSLLDRGHLGMEMARVNQSIYGEDRYMILRFEDLTQDPRKSMESVCSHLDIGFQDSLMVPSFFGQPWRGNNFDGLKFTGVSSENTGRWRERISTWEAQVIEFHFRSLMEEFDYPLEFTLAEAANSARVFYKWHNYAQRNALDVRAPAVASP